MTSEKRSVTSHPAVVSALTAAYGSTETPKLAATACLMASVLPKGRYAMLFSSGALLADVHGLVFRAIFLLAYSGGIAGLLDLHASWETSKGQRAIRKQLAIGTWAMAIVAWLTVITGTYLVYPLYRTEFRPVLASTFWNTFSMVLKTHIGWFAPILATSVALVIWRYKTQLIKEKRIRYALAVLFTIAFLFAGIAGLLGALITKALPVY